MNRNRADTAVGAVLGLVLVGGGTLTWQATQRRRAVEESMGPMMGSTAGTIHGPNPLWYVAGTLLLVGVIGAAYYVVRPELADLGATNTTEHTDAGQPSTPAPASMADDAQPEPAESDPPTRVLDLLPDDERRVLEPVLNSPGITQIKLRDRSEFSKSKVSQTVSGLEERGLVYRERQGRTYRVYPSDDLQEDP